MKAIRARIRGLGDTIESEWFELSPRLNLFHFPEERGRASFWQTFATLNPLLPCERINPFAGFPLVSRRQGYAKRVSPAKRTVALAIFNTTPELVSDLAAVSPYLYETDRIEVGRRLDCSRWINFVEIASSARWCEIAENITHIIDLTKNIAPEKTADIESITKSLQGPDRIKNGIARDLGEWLQSLPPGIGESSKQRIAQLQKAVRRAEDFHLARRVVEQNLPIVLVFTASSSPLAALLDRINARLRELGEPPAPAARDFLDEINRHLEAMPLPGPRLHLQFSETGTGVALSATPPLPATSPGPDVSFGRLQAAVSLAIAFSRVTCRTEPLLLFDCPERYLPGALHRRLGEFILTVAEFCQCCYGYASVNIFSRQKGLPRYTVSDLIRLGH